MGVIRGTRMEDDGAILIEVLKSLRKKHFIFICLNRIRPTFSAVIILFQ